MSRWIALICVLVLLAQVPGVCPCPPVVGPSTSAHDCCPAPAEGTPSVAASAGSADCCASGLGLPVAERVEASASNAPHVLSTVLPTPALTPQTNAGSRTPAGPAASPAAARSLTPTILRI